MSAFLGRGGVERSLLLFHFCAATLRALHLALFMLLDGQDDGKLFVARSAQILVVRHFTLLSSPRLPKS
jgi:hypothetical protein